MIGTLVDDRYLLLESIGSGGEAKVFRARDSATGGEVAVRLALKPVAHGFSKAPPEFHPGWVRFLQAGTDPQRGFYQVFELLRGEALEGIVKSGPLAPDRWREFVRQSLDAVSALHEAGWVHGDLNAGNFFQAEEGWKLLELPFLRFASPPGRSAMFGSIYTLSPEQIDGTTPDACSDLYALGCLYYYAACGEYPHAGATAPQIAIDRLCFPPAPLGEKAPGLSAAWASWVMMLLARSPGDRFPSAAAARQLLGVA